MSASFTCSAFPKRTAGVVLHVSSLPGHGPIGNFGSSARAWIHFLSQAGFTWWQVCPLGPTSYGDSPYQPLSAFALNPYFIDLEDLAEGGLLTSEEISNFTEGQNIQYGYLWEKLRPLLDLAAQRGAEDPRRLKHWGDLAAFRDSEKDWLRDWEKFSALRESNAFREPQRWTIHTVDESIATRAAVLQLIASTQWQRLCAYSQTQGVHILGDEPIYVSADGCDRWAHPELFSDDLVAGVPPDYFSADGQLWGNPLYNWPRHSEDNFAWWHSRIQKDLERFSAIRIDHFRGLFDYWAVAKAATHAREGEWLPGPKMAFFNAIGNLPLVAEDLGELSAGVHGLRREAKLPGMSVLQFGFPLTKDNPHHPSTITEDRVAYTGTHDNDTMIGWFNQLTPEEQSTVRSTLGEGPIATEALKAVVSSPAIAAFAPAQDLLRLSSEARLNTPGKATGNWTWRMTVSQLAALSSRADDWKSLLRSVNRV